MPQFIQQLAELHTHVELDYYPDDLPKALEYYGARIVRDLGRLHELTEGKIIIATIVEMAGTYEHLVSVDDTPSATPADFFEDTLIPAMTEVVVEEINND